MKHLLRTPLFVLPLLAPAASAQIAAAGPQSGGAAFDAAPVRVVLEGLGAGTLVMPGVFDGHVRALLHDESSGAVLMLEADLIPYHFLLEHLPAGAIDGLLTTYVDSESPGEPAVLARLQGEWAVDSDGIGSIAGRFLVSQGEVLEPRVAGVLRGTFRVPAPQPTYMIAPPLYWPPPVEVESQSIRVMAHGAAGAAALAPEQASPLPDVGPLAAEPEASGPTIIVDSFDPPYVTRGRFYWALAL